MAGRILRIAGMMSIVMAFTTSVGFAGGFTQKWCVPIKAEYYVGSGNLDDDPQLEVVTLYLDAYDDHAVFVTDGITGITDSLFFHSLSQPKPLVGLSDIDNDGKLEIIIKGDRTSDWGWYAFDYSSVKSEEKDKSPAKPILLQNYPNPFSPITSINYSVQKQGRVVIKVYNTAGQLVRTLVNTDKRIGDYTIKWDGKNDRGNKLAGGTYFYEMQVGDYKSTKKAIVLK